MKTRREQQAINLVDSLIQEIGLGQVPTQSSSYDWAVDWAPENGSAIDAWGDEDQTTKLRQLVNAGVPVKSFILTGPDDGEGATRADRIRNQAKIHSEMAALLEQGWTILFNEQNEEWEEIMLVGPEVSKVPQ